MWKQMLVDYFFLGFRQPSAAPIATPTPIQTGSLVTANMAAPIAAPTPTQLPALSKVLAFLAIEFCALCYSTVTLLARLRGLSTSVPLATAT